MRLLICWLLFAFFSLRGNVLGQGACCLIDGTCIETDFISCTTLPGFYQGDGTSCSSDPCAEPEACCLADGSCQDLTPNDCTAIGGVSQGVGSLCGLVNCPFRDFGDAPFDTLGSVLGAAHQVELNFNLGLTVDSEFDGQPDSAAMGDDTNRVYEGVSFPPGDEDGITFVTPLLAGREACIDVFLSSTNGAGMLDGWIDYDVNQEWENPSEHLFDGISFLLQPGSNTNICFRVPLPDGFDGLGETYARFRLSRMGSLLPVGLASDGEVEDYLVSIYQPIPSNDVELTSIDCVPSNNAIRLTWNGETNWAYRVQRSVNLTNQIWSSTGPYVVGAEAALNPVTNTVQHYRVTVPFVLP